MAFNDNEFADDNDGQQAAPHIQPNVYEVADDKNIEEKDLERTYLFGKGDNPANPTEGKPVGGQQFGEENQTPSGDDKNNPSRNAGYSNAYLARTEPSEEHPENSNFTPKDQEGEPDYSKAQASDTEPKPEKVERGNGENDRPDTESPYREGKEEHTEDEDENIPGPMELPDQQKVGENEVEDHIET
eukprot:gnl/Spiro4/23015_TR11366_c0_g1_i1.p2 gnl/Spiro4/23015_TR11366_c0_g1~~gnl/Spiro4/23015_TR11366_c0_g1_i1.p2  ORF type:complete len:187 (-),score=7.65 gnl/Spiro4/23015_TR11366_c0_g1_i1:249-809(-)